MKKGFYEVGKDVLAEAGIKTSTVTFSLGTIILLVALIIRLTAF